MDNIKDVQLIHLRSFISYIKQQKLKSVSILRKASALKSLFKFALSESYISSNPTLGIVLPKKNKSLPVTTEANLLQKYEHFFQQSDDIKTESEKLVFILFYQTGIRRQELINLKLGNIDTNNLKIKIVGKGNKERVIPINSMFAQRIQRYISIKHNSITQHTNSFLFSDQHGKPFNPKKVYRIVQKILSICSSVSKKSPHVLRHTFATELLNNGANINDIKELLGHANISATQIYASSSIQNLKRNYQQYHPKA